MKRFFCILLTAALLAALMAGCSAKSSQEAEGETSGADGPSAVSTSAVTDNVASERTIHGALQSFTAKTLDGGSFSASDFAAYDLTVINFWGTYCGPCIREMPDLAALKEALPENVNFITFCIDAQGNEDGAQEILDNAGLKATVITEADGDFMKVLPKIQYIPTTLFIDAKGNIVGSEIIGGVADVAQEYGAHIDAALAEIGKE